MENKVADQRENLKLATNENDKVDVKKKKNKKKANSKMSEDPSKVLVAKDVNVLNPEPETVIDVPEEICCSYCKKTNPTPTKRCSKRHQKCLPKLFCNDTCESLAHENKKAALVKKEASKVAAVKKKTAKVKNWKNTDSGQFWWHDQ